jgi:PAS domain S-box-containing protein
VRQSSPIYAHDLRPIQWNDVGADDSAWFATRPRSAVRDFFDVCEQSPDALEASVWALERAGGSLAAGGVEQQVAAAREVMRQARDGDWQPLERHLAVEGARYARSGLPLSVWYGIANRFHDKVVARAVETYSADAARLTEVLLMFSEYLERALSIIAAEYYAAKDNRERALSVRHSRVIDAAPDPVIEIDEHGWVTEWNAAAELTFGYTRDAAVGQPLTALIVPERLHAQHDAGVAHMLATSEQRVHGKRRRLTARRSDGSELQVELTLVAAGRLDGSRGIIGYLRDLSDQQHAEESSAVRDHALEQAAFGIVMTNPATREILNVNPAYARLLGYEPSELIGSTGHRLVPRGEPRIAEIQQRLDEQRHHTYEVRLTRKDGSTVSVLASTSTVETRSGAAIRISSVIDNSQRDVLEQERAVAKHVLERSAARLEILSNTGHEFAAASGDIEMLLGRVARRLAEVIGDGCTIRLVSRDGEWLEPTTTFHHPDPDIRAEIGPIFASSRDPISSGISGKVARTGIGELLPVTDTQTVVRLAAPAFQSVLSRIGVSSVLVIPLRSRGKTVGVIGFVRNRPGNPYTVDDQHLAQDLADRAGLAIDNATLVATLEQRVTERTAALEAANDELEAFSYSVSHDLRTPLRAVDGFSRLLMSDYREVFDDRAQHYMTRIRTATQRMASLIDDLLNLAQITRGSLDLSIQDLSALATDVVSELQKRDPARTIPVHIAPAVIARVDPNLVRAMFENLFGNAWKFTAKHDGAEIWFGVDAGIFYVRDTGAGFDMAFVEKLFRPFQRLHAVKEYEGSGIGLATVHRIVARHGGQIWAEAAVGKGATFYFTLGSQGDSHGRTA